MGHILAAPFELSAKLSDQRFTVLPVQLIEIAARNYGHTRRD
jgi:hypothetical protein